MVLPGKFLTKRALFQQFLIRVHNRAGRTLGLDVQQGSLPHTIEWSCSGQVQRYTFDTVRARTIGLGAITEEALVEISHRTAAVLPESSPSY
jgi:hypothetical protein